MIDNTSKNPTRIINGVVTVIYIDDWADATLSIEDLRRFRKSKDRDRTIWDQALRDGRISLSFIPVNDPAPHLEKTVIFHNGPVESDLEYLEFCELYKNDPHLTWPTE